ncbi:MAG TPA: hypothetical protein VIK50_07930, partial [Gemmatimonadaceae bacterium]
YRHRGDTWRLLGFAFIEPFGYRQITVWFRLKAFWRYFRGDHSWGRMNREGFGTSRADEPQTAATLTTRGRLTPVSVPEIR